MAQDLVTLYNLALGLAGINKRVSLPTETSPEAQACELWYPTIRDVVLSAAFWPDAKASKYLAIEAQRTSTANWVDGDPEPGWQYSYKRPADCLYPRYQADFSKFVSGRTSTGEPVIYSGTENTILVYTRKLENPQDFDANLFLTMAYALASAIAMPLHSKLTFVKFATDKADQAILSAREAAANMQELRFETMPDVLAARGYEGEISRDVYLFPYGPLVSSIGGAGVQ